MSAFTFCEGFEKAARVLHCTSHPSLVSCFLPAFSGDAGLAEGRVEGTGCEAMSASRLAGVRDGVEEGRCVFERHAKEMDQAEST